MDIGFETIGNAVLICHDRSPILATDPWIEGDAYFGSWTFSHELPEQQLDAIRRSRYIWVSHGHPDHLSPRSLKLLRNKKILLPDHVGGRIFRSLKEQGFDAHVLPNNEWIRLSDRIHVLCIADCCQDGILLIDINGRLVVNMNDAMDNGWGGIVKSIIAQYDKSFLLCLSGARDAQMVNLFDEHGRSLRPPPLQKNDAGQEINAAMARFGAKCFIPFSSMHQYQRSDSAWANRYRTKLEDYSAGFDLGIGRIFPAYIQYDCAGDRAEEIDPPAKKEIVRDPAEFGDDWSESLDAKEAERAGRYFKAVSRLERHFDFINLRVGGKDNIIELAKNRFKRGVTFEAPRGSLMSSVTEEIFDDMLIGNFMKTTLHGEFPSLLSPEFTHYVGKFADNGRAKSAEELEVYLGEYRKQYLIGFLRHCVSAKSPQIMRSLYGSVS